MTARLPKLSKDRQGHYYSMVRDASKSSGRAKVYWGQSAKEAKWTYRENIARVVVEHAANKDRLAAYTEAEHWTLVDMAEYFYRDKQVGGVSPKFLNQIKACLGFAKDTAPAGEKPNRRKRSRNGTVPFLPWLYHNHFDPSRHTPAELTSTHLKGYWQYLGDTPAIGRKQANHFLNTIRMLLHWGAENHGLRHPPLGAVKPFKKGAKAGHGQTHDKTPLTWDTIIRLLAKANPIDRAMVMLGINCGFGNTDIGTLQLTDVNLEKGTIRNERRKTGTQRDFHLWPETVNALRVYLAKYRGTPRLPAHAGLFFIGRKGNPACWEVIDESGRLDRGDSVHQHFVALCKRAGVQRARGMGFYILRHTYATRIGEQSSDAREVQAAMAHSHIHQQDTYRHATAMKAQAAQRRLYKEFTQEVPKSLRMGNDADGGDGAGVVLKIPAAAG